MANRSDYGPQLASQPGGTKRPGHSHLGGRPQTTPAQIQNREGYEHIDIFQLVNEQQRKINERLDHLEKKVVGFTKTNIRRLRTYSLNTPLDVLIEPDGEGFLARTVDLNLYGYGEDSIEAVENLIYEIESLYEDLLEDDNFSSEWLNVKRFLKGIIED